jgi:hypothetical protein
VSTVAWAARTSPCEETGGGVAGRHYFPVRRGQLRELCLGDVLAGSAGGRLGLCLLGCARLPVHLVGVPLMAPRRQRVFDDEPVEKLSGLLG